jgi:hypothetical protein
MGSLSGTSVESMQGSSVLEQMASDLQSGLLPVDRALNEIGEFANSKLGLQLEKEQLLLQI